MSTTDDTNAIGKKKNPDTGNLQPDFKGFIINYIVSIVVTIGILIFIIGGLGLYTTKVAQANILPDDVELAPYTIFDRIVKNKPIDINIMRSFFSENKEILSQKVEFYSQEYLDSFNKSFLCYLKKYADPNYTLFPNAYLYFSFVYDNIVAKNFFAINTIFFYLSYLPESAIMFLYGLFGIFIWIGLYIFNCCISIFYHIINIPQLFRIVSEHDNTKWETTEDISFLRFMKFILFFFLWIPLGMLSVIVTPIVFTFYGLIAPLFASYKFKQTNNRLNVINFINDTFIYKKLFFFILATLSLFSNGITYLGNNFIVGIIVAVIVAYFMGLYTNEIPDIGVNGFNVTNKHNITQSNVNPINYNDPMLVEICQQIPINDSKMDKITKGVKPRTLISPTEFGGDSINNTGTGPEKGQYYLGGKKQKHQTQYKKYNIKWA